ncbi:MAG: DEAD/DEAH box helicase [Nitrososphaeraceae archaeon]
MSKKARLLDPRIKPLLEHLGYSSLYPPQEQALSKGLLDGRNLLVTTPTASGKTLVALIAAMNIIMKGLRVVYLTPLRALTTEKFQDFRILEELELFDRRIKVKVASSDYSSAGRELGQADVIVLTNEKMDSLIRHRCEWIHEVGLFVADEVHLLGERDRGPTLEMMLTKIRKMYSQAQVLALSATIENSNEIARWLGCELIESNWRPTKLVEGVYDHGSLLLNDGKESRSKKITPSAGTHSTAAVDVALECIENGGQAMIFGETRKRAVSLAQKAAPIIYNKLDKLERKSAGKVALQISEKGEDTEITRNLSELVSKGVGFHHAGLGVLARNLVEMSFKTGVIKLLTATPTLAAGVNLPARRVILASIFRYDAEYGGNMPISVLEYKQICGRAGRPSYDTFGEAIIIADVRTNAEEIYNHYILVTPEPICSQLKNDRSIRIHLLSTISTLPGIKKSEIYDLFGSTLLAQNKGKASITLGLDSAIAYLERESCIKSKNNRYISTEFGKQISLLYIDPLTGVQFRNAIESLENKIRGDKKSFASIGEYDDDEGKDSIHTFHKNRNFYDSNDNKYNHNHTLGFLHLISESPDFYPKFGLRKRDIEEFCSDIEEHRSELIYPINEFECSRSLWALYRWINESTDKILSDKIGVEPGDMHRIVEIADWLAYSLYEVAKIMRRGDLLVEIHRLRLRIKYGVKEELLKLIRLKGIGRVRARSLYGIGFTDLTEIANASEAQLSAVSNIGPTIAKNIKEQLQNKN